MIVVPEEVPEAAPGRVPFAAHMPAETDGSEAASETVLMVGSQGKRVARLLHSVFPTSVVLAALKPLGRRQ